MLCTTHEVRATDGTRLFVRLYTPKRQTARRTLLWTHGVGEHGGRYEHIVERLTAVGWRIILGDLRGHGHSGGPRGHVSTFSQYADDLASLWSACECQPHSTALLGNSMGALVTIRAVQLGRVTPAAVVLLAPLLGVNVPIPGWLVRLGRFVVRFAPRARFRSRIDPNNMTQDPYFQQLRREDSLRQRYVTAGWYFAMNQALRAAHEEASKFHVPLLAMQGMGDATVDPEAVAAWVQQTSSPDRQVVLLPGQLHELLHEVEWAETLHHICTWLQQRVP